MTKPFLIAFVLAVGLLSAATVVFARPYSTTVEFFYADLEPYGRWVDHPMYGTVWVPANHEPGWAPYTEGRWVWTSDYGWYWDSDEDFGWATYHYGRWILTADLGWVWVPDNVWGPAWVDWRYQDGYVGWAPMPPEYRWRQGTFITAGIDLGTPRYASSWVFVSDADFARGSVRAHRLPQVRNRALLASSVRVTNYASLNGRIVNRSIDAARIRERTKIRIDTVRVGVASSLEERSNIRAQGIVPIFKPRIAAKAKLDLNGAFDARLPTDNDVLPPSDENVDVRPSGTGSISNDVDTGGATPGLIGSSPLSRGLNGGGLGVGAGVGGGIRLGR